MNKHIFKYDQEFKLESGESLPGFQLTYHTAGTLNERGDNVIWVCHALTANSDVSEWWTGLYGKGKPLNPEKHFIVCANILGSCYGSTGALSTNPNTNDPYYHSFPVFTIRDIVSALDTLRVSLGINKIHTLIGGSLGGQQVLEWAIYKPDLMSKLIPVATNAQHSPWGIAFNESQRMAIQVDPTWKNNSPDAGIEGMKAARSIALLSYRDYRTYHRSQREETNDQFDNFKASSYQVYQGDKLANRFDAFSYWYLSKAMDSHNVGRGRGSVKEALSQIKAETLIVSINTDNLFPVKEQVLLFNHIQNAHLEIIESGYGHDGFLTETEKLTPILNDFIRQESKQQNLKEEIAA